MFVGGTAKIWVSWKQETWWKNRYEITSKGDGRPENYNKRKIYVVEKERNDDEGDSDSVCFVVETVTFHEHLFLFLHYHVQRDVHLRREDVRRVLLSGSGFRWAAEALRYGNRTWSNRTGNPPKSVISRHIRNSTTTLCGQFSLRPVVARSRLSSSSFITRSLGDVSSPASRHRIWISRA